MLKRLISLTVLLCLSLSLSLPSSAAFIDNKDISNKTISTEIVPVYKPLSTQNLDKFGSISIKESLLINGVENDLYPTFDDISVALQQLKSIAPTYYALINEKVNLKDRYTSSFDDFMSTDFSLDISDISATASPAVAFDSPTVLSRLSNEQEDVALFFDLYENKAKNEELKHYLSSESSPDPDVLAYMLPYDSVFVKEYFDALPPSAAAAQTFSVAKGTAYAERWATGRDTLNYPDYSLTGGDCANFTSQILVAGGINMHDQYPNESKGWWCRKTSIGTVNPGPTFAASLSWKRADSFVRFMGTSGNEYTYFKTFSQKVKAGDFISVDNGKDGDWDHMGYVTAVGSLGVYNGKEYKDFRVAQHSKDYHAWVSSNTNGWENDDGSAKFAIVRRNAVA